ncbi:MAG: transcription antitermination protein NusB [Bacteroidales bacterium]|nr:transcription antitermination protein NusB [Bacteroidales bacterium]
MLNRRILRIKAFKVVYSRVENPLTLKEAEAELERSCEATRDLYLFLLAVAGPLTEEAKSRLEAARGKFNPTPEELNPNTKFIENRIAPLLAEDPDFTKIIKKKKFSWDNDDVFLRHLYESVREKDWFKAYLSAPGSSLQEDAALFARIYEEEFPDNKELEDILTDASIYWNDELEYALTWCCRTMDALGRGLRWNLPGLYMSEVSGSAGKESDRDFVYNLVRAALRNFDKYMQMIADVTPKWETNRICATDLALIICGLAEADTFASIDYRTTINEFVEISKYYSTPESRGFVNGVLDKLINKK